MKDKATFQNKVKVLNKLFDSGCDTEKKLQQLDMEAILKIPNITIPYMVCRLKSNTRCMTDGCISRHVPTVPSPGRGS